MKALMLSLIFLAGPVAADVGAMSADQYRQLLQVLNESGQYGLDVETDTYRQGGQHIGCGILYSAWVADWTEGQITPVFISGGLNYLSTSSAAPVLQIKTSLVDYRLAAGEVSSSPALPHSVYVSTPSWSLAGSDYRSQHPPSYPKQSLVYPDPDAEILAALASYEPLTVAFNRTQGGLDLQLNLHLAPEGKEKLRACLRGVIDELLEASEK